MKNDNSFAVQDRLAGEYLSKKHQGKIYAVWKSTTAGVTTSLLKVGCEKKRKVILVSPTNKLLKKTKELVEGLLSFKPKIENISANKELCRQVKEEIKQYPNLEFLSSHRKHNCKGCQYNNPTDCLLQYILNNDFDVLGLTYAKLNTLIEVDEGYAKQLLNKLFAMDVLLLF
ncbi:MAG: hypothetical protein L6265_10795 [Thermoplasmatales archaeon]|nr:hypothetical protein [Thermoplasmatales archaeon]